MIASLAEQVPGPVMTKTRERSRAGRGVPSGVVVETTHLAAATITNNGLNHSDKVRVVERFRLGEDGQTLLSTQWFEDPEVLDTPGGRFIAWKRKPGQYVNPYECDPTFIENYKDAQGGRP